MIHILKCLTEDKTEYKPIPFWSWNDKLEPEELKRQISWMQANGIGGFFMHARSGLKTPYLSEEWLQCIETCCDEAKKQRMQAWVYDENGWPSGFVGGKLLENEENRDMYILHEIGAFDSKADVSYLLTETRLQRVTTGEASKEYLNLYFKRSASSVDILNPKVVEQFLAETHEKYKTYFGDDFSKRLVGFFTDEPQYYRYGTPYTPIVQDYFKEQYGEELWDVIGLLFVEKEGYRSLRYRYWLAMQKLMLENFAKQVYTWCDSHDVKLTGHYVEEVSMGLQIMCCGGVMPFYEYEHIPGIDKLGRETDNELAAKQLSSVARQLGKKQAMTETFGCCGWDVTPGELRRIAGFQYANGVNVMCQHLIPYSERGQRKFDYPAHFNQLNPWVKEYFKDFNTYFSRLGQLLATGKEVVNVAMLHPIRSAYLDYKRGEETYGDDFELKEQEERLRQACRLFSARGISYHFLDETLLETHGFVNKNQIGCGKCTYSYLVLPNVLTMGKHTEMLIREFVSYGGKVLIIGDGPEYLEGEPYAYSYLKNNCTLEEIIEAQPFSVTNVDTEIYCAYRTIKKTPYLFLQNASSEKSYTQTFRFQDDMQSFTVIDPVTFEIEKLPLTITIPRNGSLLLVPTRESVRVGEESQEYELRFKNAEVSFENNYLTIDVMRYSKDGENYSDTMPQAVLFKKLLREKYKGKLWLKYDFQIKVLPEQLTIMAEMAGVSSYSINGKEFILDNTFEDEPSFRMADITDLIQKGENSYEVVLDWHQSEETYYALFGENVTENLRNCVEYESEISAVYLMGKFGVYSVDGFDAHDEQTLCAHHFYIGEASTKIENEPVEEGFPFFRGKLTMSQKITFETTNILLKPEGRYLTARIRVNGKEAGELLFDRSIDISPYTTKGENLIEVEFLIGNRNFLGPFHYEGKERTVSPGVFATCNLPDSEEGYPRYKFYKFY